MFVITLFRSRMLYLSFCVPSISFYRHCDCDRGRCDVITESEHRISMQIDKIMFTLRNVVARWSSKKQFYMSIFNAQSISLDKQNSLSCLWSMQIGSFNDDNKSNVMNHYSLELVIRSYQSRLYTTETQFESINLMPE